MCGSLAGLGHGLLNWVAAGQRLPRQREIAYFFFLVRFALRAAAELRKCVGRTARCVRRVSRAVDCVWLVCGGGSGRRGFVGFECVCVSDAVCLSLRY